MQRGIGRDHSGVGLPQLVDHHRLDHDGGFQILIGGRDRGLLDNERSRPLAHGQGAQLYQQPPTVKPATAQRPSPEQLRPALRAGRLRRPSSAGNDESSQYGPHRTGSRALSRRGYESNGMSVETQSGIFRAKFTLA
jgi:hypothetical protein